MDREEDIQPQEQENRGSEVANNNTKNVNSKDIKNFFNKFTKNKASSRTLVKAISKILVSVGWIIIALIIIIGIIMFLLTMPGMVMEKLKGLFKALADAWSAWWGDDTAGEFDNSEIYNVLNYLDDMGYDLKGYGFVTDFLNSTEQFDEGQEDAASKKEGGLKVTEDGVIRNKDNEIVTGVSDFIRAYLISENYIYTIKNNNIVTQSKMVALWEHFKNLFTDDMSKKSGMLAFFHDGEAIGESTNNAYDSFERGYIKFEGKKLLIKKGWTNSAMSYSLDGWTGRYGMPVDFLLTVHLATQMPDLAYDMTQSFETEVRILLHKSDGEVCGSYKGANGPIDSSKLEKAINGFEGKNKFTEFINWVDDWGLSESEATTLIGLGIIPDGHNPCKEGEEETDGNCGCIVDDDGNLTTIGAHCKEFIKYVIRTLKKENDYSYSTYTPYIENVTDHWFRDVYFITDSNDKFVDYDYQYELITGERWTLYETDDNGDFVYYKMNPDGSTSDEKYTGKVISGETILNGENGEPLRDDDGNIKTERVANRGEDGTLVVKKAKTINLSEKYEDLGWNPIGGGKYSAYDTKEGTFDESQPMYTEEEISKEKEEWKKEVLKNVFIHINIGDITQTGEGLRTETNAKIKKMFLMNNYFKYDGSRQRAEIIHALREKSGVGYGPITDDDKLDTEYELKFPKVPDGIYTSEAQDGKYKLRDYVGNVSFQQDALTTFAMLENSHTVDADYIYKDFKELVVELGYFQKEELLDSKPKLLQWIVPEIGSGGYPDRSIDKREEEYGTLVHSKMDIDANKRSTILFKLQDFLEAETESDNDDLNGGEGGTKLDQPSSGLLGMSLRTSIRTNLVGALDGDVDPSQVSVEEFLEAAADVHSRMEGDFWEYCAAGKHSGSSARHTADGSCPGNYATYESANANGKTADCSSYVSWVLQEVGIIKDKYNTTGMYTALAEYILTKDEAGELQPGDIVLSSGHVQINGENNMQYNAGSTNAIQNPPKEYFPDFYTHVIRLPFGGSKGKGAPYEGYEGNEAVVSPVTGILMEYGTYNEEEADENRQNIDLKYNGLLEGKELEKITVKDPGTGEETTEIKYPSDKVGYAVIKVLDAETYKKLESTVKNRWQETSLIAVNEKSKDYNAINKHLKFNDATTELLSENRDWDKVEETVYGYKEFAEQYERFGIGGYYVYIDGFKCETVDEELTKPEKTDNPEEDDTDSKKVIPKGEELTLDSFKISESDVNNEKFEPDTQSLYEPDEVSKLMSKDETEKLEAESAIKADASLGITFTYQNDEKIDEDGNVTTGPNEYILIKEGTVLGRTLTDYELLEGEDFRNGKYGTYDEYVEAQKEIFEKQDEKPDKNDEEADIKTDKVPLVGNYLRLIMQKTDGDIVENVEDYMKLDEGETKSNSEIDWEFWYFSPYEGGGWDGKECGPEAVKNEAMYANNFDVGIIQWTTHPTLSPGGVQNFCKRAAEIDSSMCGVLAKYGSMSDSTVVEQSNRTQMQKEFTEICNKDRDGFTVIQIQIAMEDYFDKFCEQNKCEWLKDAPSVVQGTVMSAAVCNGPYTKISLTQGDDEGNIKAAINNIRNSKPALEPRLQAQESAALDILNKRVTIDEVETWVRTKQTPANYNWNERS